MLTTVSERKAKADRRRPSQRPLPRRFRPLFSPFRHIVQLAEKIEQGPLWSRGLFVGVALFVIAWAIWTARAPLAEFASFLSEQDVVSEFVLSYGAFGPLALAAAQLLQVLVAFIPGHVFLVAAGYVYGLPLGFLMNITFIVAASQLSFLLARRYGRPIVNKLAKPEQVDKWQAIAEERGFIFFTIAFVLPVFPTDVMNFVAGLTGMSPRKFLAANFLGRLPSAIVLTLIGSHGLEFPDYAWWVIGALVAVLYVSGRLVMLRIEQRYGQKEKAQV